MKTPLSLLLAPFLAAFAAPAWGQLQVEIVDTLPSYLLFEPVVLKIRVVNGSGRIVDLDQANGKSWLRFLVTKGEGMMVRPAQEFLQPRVRLEPGDEARFSFNLTPYYSLRDVGTFTVQAVVRVPGMPGDIMSRPVRINILRGHPMWSKNVTPLGASGPRHLSLITQLVRESQAGTDRLYLYAQIESETENLVFLCRQLGPLMQGDRIESMVDATYGWHVLFRANADDYLYYQFDMDGRTVERKGMSKAATRPHLVASDGGIQVVGGISSDDMKGGDTLRGSQPAAVLQPGTGVRPSAPPKSPAPDAQKK